jgi:hypothetical protein
MEVCSRNDECDDDDGLNWIESSPGSDGNKRTDHDFLKKRRTALSCQCFDINLKEVFRDFLKKGCRVFVYFLIEESLESLSPFFDPG